MTHRSIGLPRPNSVRGTSSVAVLAGVGVLASLSVGSALGAPPGTLLPPGTVPELRGVVSGALVTAPVPTSTGNLLTINQTLPRAIIDWNTFNIGSGSEVRFVQPSASSAALNRIFGLDPSIIQGRLTANGQVYLLNQNGILFDRGAQVDVNTLVASTLNITQEQFLAGLISGLDRPAFSGTSPGSSILVGAFGPSDAGAPVLRANAGGSILLFAPRVENNGVITAPGGQVILASGNRVFLASNDPADFSMRGLLVEVQAGTGDVNLSSLIANRGQVSADQGNVTLAGLAINQTGRVSASTALLLNGSVYLQAREKPVGPLDPAGYTPRAGRIELARGSETATPQDLNDRTTFTSDQDYGPYRPVVRLEAQTINSAGSILSPSGRVILRAFDPARPDQINDSRIYLGPGARIDVSGSVAELPASANLVNVPRLTSNDLRDSPLQRGGILQGMPVVIDARRSALLFDVAPYRDGIRRTLPEKGASGGSISIASGGDFILRAGAELDVRGGGIDYSAGTLPVTYLVSADRRVFDVHSAPKELQYIGILDRFERSYERWGITDVFKSTLLGARVPASFEGRPGGSISIVASGGTVLDGRLVAGSRTSREQLLSGQTLSSGSLTLGAVRRPGPNPDFQNENVVFADAPPLADDFNATTPLGARRETVHVPGDLFEPSFSSTTGELIQPGFSAVSVFANGSVSVPRDTVLEVPPGGAVSIAGNRVRVEGTIGAPGGSVNIAATTTARAGEASAVVASGATVSTAGLWVNELLDGATGPILARERRIDGGSVVLSSSFRAATEPGSLLDVSGGARLDVTGRLVAGNAGSILVEGGVGVRDDLLFGPVSVQGEMRGFSAVRGGTLSVRAASVTVGQSGAGDLALPADFFQRGGFTTYNVSGRRGVAVAPGTAIGVVADSLVLDSSRAAGVPSGRAVGQIGSVERLGVDQRQPASLSLSAPGANEGNLATGIGSSIEVDPRGSVSLAAGTSLDLAGRVRAPGGTISVSLATSGEGIVGSGELRLRGTSVLDTSGLPLITRNASGQRSGEVLSGGSVTLSAFKNALRTDQGSLILVDGASGVVDVPTTLGGARFVSVPVASDAGTIRVTGTERMTLLGGYSGRAPLGAAGGAFAIEINRSGDPLFNSPRVLAVTQAAAAPVEAANRVVAGVAVEPLVAAGMDRLRLSAEDTVEFVGTVDARFPRGLSVDAPLIAADGTNPVTLQGATVTLANTYTVPTAGAATPPAGASRLVVEAGNLDVLGAVQVGRVSELTLGANADVRLSGRPANVVADPDAQNDSLVGSLAVAGDLRIRAAQVYPTSYSNFTVTAVGTGRGISILPSGTAPGAALSAAGRLTLTAGEIVQGGTVKAPLGEISLVGQRIVAGEGSLTSVAGEDRTYLLGSTLGGQVWTYAGLAPLSGLPDKRVSLQGGDIQIASTARIDVSGGGDVQAVEFVAGPGGSRDLLVAENTFAILPGVTFGTTPFDTDLALRRDLGIGPLSRADRGVFDSITIGPGTSVAPGTYTLLPGYWATVPGAYAVRLQTGTAFRDLQPGDTRALADGSAVASAYRTLAGTGVRESRSLGVTVTSAEALQREVEYAKQDASFFTRQAIAQDRAPPRLPDDAGSLVLAATEALRLDGAIEARRGGPGARGARVDIDSRFLAVVDDTAQPLAPRFLRLPADRLSRIDGSIVLGGSRSATASGDVLSVRAEEVLIANTAANPLTASELIMASRGEVRLAASSRVVAAGDASGSAPLLVAGDGALVMAATDPTANVVRSGTSTGGGTGRVTLEAGAVLSATGALHIEGTREAVIRNVPQLADGGRLTLASSRIALGSVATEGMPLGPDQLGAIRAGSDVRLIGYQSIDVGDSLVLRRGVGSSLELDTPLLRGRSSGAAVSLAADDVTLRASSGVLPPTASAPGSGTLFLLGNEVVLGPGEKAIEGFSTIALRAEGSVIGEGTGSLRTAGELAISTPLVSARTGADQSWSAVNGAASYPVTLVGIPGMSPGLVEEDAGARLALSGRSIVQGTSVVLPSGWLSLRALGTDAQDGIAFSSGSSTVLEGFSRAFSLEHAVLPGGALEARAVGGDITLASDARVSVAGRAGGADAGSVLFEAAAVRLDGAVDGRAGAEGRGGIATVDVRALPVFGAANAALESGAFNGSRRFRVRQGDVSIAAADRVTAQEVGIVADGGTLYMLGHIDASSPRGGGSVEIEARNGVVLGAGSAIAAAGTSAGAPSTDANAPGGRVVLSAAEGLVTMMPGAVVDVSAGARGDAGSLVVRVPRTAGNDGVHADLRGEVKGRSPAGKTGRIIVEGVRVYDESLADTSSSSLYAADFQTFTATVDPAGVRAGLVLDGISPGDVRVRGGVELRSAGDLAVVDPWDLTDPFSWLVTGEPGTLTLRAAGSVRISNSIGLPLDDFVPVGETWTLRIGAGVDPAGASLRSFRPLDTLITANTGDVRLETADSRVRTGTGSIAVYAGRDVRISHPQAAFYTTGESGPSADPFERFARNGGDITLLAQRDVAGVDLRGQWVNGWLRRTTYATQAEADQSRSAEWWPTRNDFAHQVGALAGGSVSVAAGRDVVHLGAVTPTSGEVAQGSDGRELVVRGGGDLSVRAGRDIVGGEFLLGRGEGSIVAGRTAGAGTAITAFVMGASGDPRDGGADLRVFAGRDVRIQNVGNPTALTVTGPTSSEPGFQNVRQFLYTYADDSSFTAIAATGGIDVFGMYRNVVPGLGAGATVGGPALFPPKVALIAPNGSIRAADPSLLVSETFGLYPSSSGTLRLLSQGDIERMRVVVSDLQAAYLPSWDNTSTPDSSGNAFVTRGIGRPQLPQPIARGGLAREGAVTAVAGYPYVIESAQGTIFESQFYLPQRSYVRAGRDIENVRLELQNVVDTDVTIVRAARDIKYPDQLRTGQLQFDPLIRASIGGGGILLMQAGRNVDMGGRTQGILGVARQDNPNLPSSSSAQLIVAAGVTGDLRLPALEGFFAELLASGLANDRAGGDSAIARFFAPGAVGQGSINTAFSPIQTLGGSTVTLLAPAGDIVAGLTTPPRRPIGIQTLRGGAVRAYLDGDLSINQGKVLTAQGGDILLYTSGGSIDAGRGALTSRTTTPPRVSRDAQGNLVFEFSVDVAGSGIRSATSDPDGPGPLGPPPAGDVYLFAPRGVIDAGEAGIASGGNLVIAALQVVNAANISAGGTSVGVPQAPVSLAAGLTGVTNVAAGAGKAAEDATREATRKAQENVTADTFRPSFITVEVLGFGN